MNPAEIDAAGLAAGQSVRSSATPTTASSAQGGRLKVMPFDLPDGCVAGYYPEMNPLVPLSHHDAIRRRRPQSVPVRIKASASA